LNGLERFLFALVSFLLYSEGHRLRAAPFLWRFEDWSVVAGAAGLIVFAISSESAKKWLQKSVPQFLGRISYSLYLLHTTVLFVLTTTVFGKMPRPCFIALYVSIALILSALFNHLVEQPFIRLSRSVTAKRVVETEAVVQ